MKVCAITMVYRDYWALSQWYAHYARHLGSSQLYIVAHGPDTKIADLCPGANVITIPRDDLSSFDRKRGEFLNNLQDKLGAKCDWVIRTDVDELICLDPSHYSDFNELLSRHKSASALFALGLDLIEAAEDTELSERDAALSNRRHAVFSGHYSKAFAVRHGTHMMRHGVIAETSTDFILPRGVYLVHLKYANVDALTDANALRAEIAAGDAPGLPGQAWREAHRHAERFLAAFEALPSVDWEVASSDAYAQLAVEPETEADPGIIRAKSIQFKARTIVPPWFKTS